VRVVVSCDMRSRSEGGGEDERVEFSVPPLALLRVCFGDRGVLGEESEDLEFRFDVWTVHDGDGKDKMEREMEGSAGMGTERKKDEAGDICSPTKLSPIRLISMPG